jgi:hypothetical protein
MIMKKIFMCCMVAVILAGFTNCNDTGSGRANSETNSNSDSLRDTTANSGNRDTLSHSDTGGRR